MAWTVKRLDTRIESQILIGMVTSDEFLTGITPIVRLEFFTSNAAKTIAKWCVDYYQNYIVAPGLHIEDIFNEYRRTKPPVEDIEEIEEFLKRLSTKYEQEEVFNVNYVLDQSENYFKERSLKILHDKLEESLLGGNILEAQEAVGSYYMADRITSVGNEPLSDMALIQQTMSHEEIDELFTMPGDLGVMMGPFKRGCLIAIAAPPKRGKTWSLQDIGLQAYYNKLNVAFFSLEMTDRQMTQRLVRGVTGLPQESGTYLFPVWDCLKNQLGQCDKRDMTNPIVAELVGSGRKRHLEKKPYPVENYRPCTKCNKGEVATWLEPRELTGVTYPMAKRHLEAMQETIYAKFKLVTWPAYSAGLSEIKSCLHSWEYIEDFRPDVILIDYDGILKPESNYREERHNIDRTWKTLKSLAQSTNSLVVTATQTKRSTLETGNVGQADIAEDIRKLAHVEMMFGISQTADEKRWGVARIGMLAQRHDEFDVISQCYILQQLSCGQFCLDSRLKK